MTEGLGEALDSLGSISYRRKLGLIPKTKKKTPKKNIIEERMKLRIHNLCTGKYDNMTGAQIRELFKREDAEELTKHIREALR